MVSITKLGGRPIRSDFLETDALSALLWSLTPDNKVVCEVALATGWRIDDVLELKYEQVQRARQMKRHGITITERKTGKKSTRYFSKQMLAKMEIVHGRYWVFEGARDWRKHRTRQAVFLDLKRAAKRFNVRLNLSPHSLRKNYAVYLRRQGKSLPEIQKQLNHDSLTTTLLYALADELTEKNA